MRRITGLGLSSSYLISESAGPCPGSPVREISAPRRVRRITAELRIFPLRTRENGASVMAMTAARFRRIALGLDGAEEREHMGHPDFRVNGRIFATLTEDERKGMVKLTPDQQSAYIKADGTIFEPASGAWGRQGCTMVMLRKADEETIGAALTDAWPL